MFPGQRPSHLGRFDMIMKVVSEGLYVGDALLSPLRGKVSREKDFTLLADSIIQ